MLTFHRAWPLALSFLCGSLFKHISSGGWFRLLYTSALHAEGRQFEPGRNHVNFSFRRFFFPIVSTSRVVPTFEPVDEILKCEHSNESYWAVLSCGTVCYAVQSGFNFESVDGILKCDHSNRIQMKTTEQYFPVRYCLLCRLCCTKWF